MSAYLLRAQQAALQGDHERTVRELRGAVDRGYDRFIDLEELPFLAGVRDTPVFQELIRDVAGTWIDRSLLETNLTQGDLFMLARAYAARGETDQAVATLERALRLGGPYDADLRRVLARLRRPGR
jgi:tetratricopeptide (TPR) repeat protein